MDVVTPSTSAAKGIPRSALYRGARDGTYEKIARGIYLTPGTRAADWDQLEAATRRPDATICLVSALAHHDLTDEIPAALDVAIPRGARVPVGSPSIRWHAFDRPTFEIGRGTIPIAGSDVTIGMYSPERSIADAFRLRGALGYELGRDALREWLRRGGKPSTLVDVALRLPRARQPVLHALDLLA